MAVDWQKHSVSCCQCGNGLMRRLFRPKDGKKIERFFCDTTCKGIWQQSQKEWGKEWLYQKYTIEKLDMVQIGAIVRRDPKTVFNWLRGYGIATRPRGANHSHLPKDGSTFLGRHHSAETRKVLRDIALADGRMPFKKENGPPMRGKRGAQTTRWKGGITPERQAFYTTDDWKAAVKVVWARANAKCERCGVHHNTTERRGTFHIHHVVSFAVRELRAEPSNLVLLCRTCHLFIHSNANIDGAFIGEQCDACA